MKGLILKDLYTLKKQFSFLSVYVIIIAVLSIMSGNSHTLIAAVSIVVVMSPLTAMSYDHQCQWEKYADALPVTRADIVTARYLLGIILIVPMFLYDIIINILSSKSITGDVLLNSVFISLIISGASIIAFSFMMPFIFKFGVEKGRIIMIIFCMVVAGGVGAFLSVDISENIISILSNKALFALIVFAASAVMFVISIMISTKIYEKKEF